MLWRNSKRRTTALSRGERSRCWCWCGSCLPSAGCRWTCITSTPTSERIQAVSAWQRCKFATGSPCLQSATIPSFIAGKTTIFDRRQSRVFLGFFVVPDVCQRRPFLNGTASKIASEPLLKPPGCLPWDLETLTPPTTLKWRKRLKIASSFFKIWICFNVLWSNQMKLWRICLLIRIRSRIWRRCSYVVIKTYF